MRPSAGSGAAAAQTEEIRLRTFRTQVKNHHEQEVDESRDRHAHEMERLNRLQAEQLQSLQGAYEVKISQEAERLEESLHRARLHNESKLQDEEKRGEELLARTKTANQQKIDSYRRNAQDQIEKVRDELQKTTQAMHSQARKTATRDKSGTKT